jgi:hypothetical protein
LGTREAHFAILSIASERPRVSLAAMSMLLLSAAGHSLDVCGFVSTCQMVALQLHSQGPGRAGIVMQLHLLVARPSRRPQRRVRVPPARPRCCRTAVAQPLSAVTGTAPASDRLVRRIDISAGGVLYGAYARAVQFVLCRFPRPRWRASNFRARLLISTHPIPRSPHLHSSGSGRQRKSRRRGSSG